jgi:hypothetical protein
VADNTSSNLEREVEFTLHSIVFNYKIGAMIQQTERYILFSYDAICETSSTPDENLNVSSRGLINSHIYTFLLIL